MSIDIRYEDLLSGDYIELNGVGHIRSPKLKEMWPTSGIGWDKYNSYIFFLKTSREQLARLIGGEPKGTLYDFIMSNDGLRKLYEEAFSFFIFETIVNDYESDCFLSVVKKDDRPDIYGKIDKDNFDDVRAVILTLNYVTISQTDINTKHSSEASEDAWNRIQEYLNEQQEKTDHKVDETMMIGNILSKLCAIHPTYNFTNVYELTVFQFYDAFFQTSYMRSIDFSESIVSTHGSKEFKYEAWLNPIKNY